MKKRLVLTAVFIVSVAGHTGCAVDPISKYGGDTLFAGLPQATSASSRFKKLSNIGYTVGYSEHRKDPLWAAYRLKRMENPLRVRCKYGERGCRYVYMEAGHISQNIYLQAVSLRLGSVCAGAFSDEKVNKLIDVDGWKEAVIYLHPVGSL